MKDPGDPTLLSAMGKQIKITELQYVTLPSVCNFNVTLSMYVENGADSKIYRSDIFNHIYLFLSGSSGKFLKLFLIDTLLH